MVRWGEVGSREIERRERMDRVCCKVEMRKIKEEKERSLNSCMYGGGGGVRSRVKSERKRWVSRSWRQSREKSSNG